MSGPSLRHAYSPAADSWSFDPTSPSITQAQQPPYPSPFTTTRVDLPLPSASPSFPELDAGTWPRKLLTLLLVQYASTGIAMPFEGAKVLSQVEWLPKEGVLDWAEELVPEPEQEEDYESDVSDAGPSYFQDLSPSPIRRPSRRLSVRRKSRTLSAAPAPMVIGIYKRPPWALPPYGDPGVWNMLKRITRSRQEGFWTLWNGQLPSTMIDIATSAMQPFFQTLLSSLPFLHNSSIPSSLGGPSPIPFVLSHVLTALVLIPLDHLRTHLILYPSSRSLPPPDRPARPSIHWDSLVRYYTHPHLLYPTLITAALPQLLSLLLPRLYPFAYLPAPHSHPLTQPILSLIFTSVSLLITMPLETVKRRLQAQTPLNLIDPPEVDEDGAPVLPKHRVLARPKPYHGMIDALYRIVTEETSQPLQPAQARERSTSWFGFGSMGFRQLYRGYGMALSAGVIVFVLGFITGDLDEPGWAEL